MSVPRVATRRSEITQATAVAGELSGPAARIVLARLCAAGFVAYCSYAICRTPLLPLPLFARELGAGPSLIGFDMGASTLTGIVVKLPAGALSDIFGRRWLLLAGALVFATLPFTYLAASTLLVLILLRFAHGSATAIFGPVASATLSDIVPPGRRGTWLSTYSTAQGAGQALGPVLAGYLIAAGRFDLAFAAAGLIGVGCRSSSWPAGAVLWRLHRTGSHGRSSSAASPRSDVIVSCWSRAERRPCSSY
jgi:MFS family permease